MPPKPYTIERIVENMKRNTIIDPITNCWLFQGASSGPTGHCKIHFKNHDIYIHRFSAYIHWDFDLTSEILILHKQECPNSNCWNPIHLYEGTYSENTRDAIIAGTHNTVARLPKTHCIHGHEYTPENTHINKKGHRKCKQCHNEKERARGQANRDLYGGYYK